jgi:hypothetical protein
MPEQGPRPVAVVILPGTGASRPIYVEIIAPSARPHSGASPWSP